MCKKNEVEQIFIRVRTTNGSEVTCTNKDINDANDDERYTYYNSISKGQVSHILEQLLKENKILKGGR